MWKPNFFGGFTKLLIAVDVPHLLCLCVCLEGRLCCIVLPDRNRFILGSRLGGCSCICRVLFVLCTGCFNEVTVDTAVLGSTS